MSNAVSGVDLSMSRWEDNRDDFEASEENLEQAKKKQELTKRECPFCGELFGQLPRHMRHCNE